MTKSHKRKPQGQRLTAEEKQWIQTKHTSGQTEDGIPWVAVPNMPDREGFTVPEIIEALTGKKAKVEKVED